MTTKHREEMLQYLTERGRARADALDNLRRVLETALTVVAPKVWEGTITQFRADLIALGVHPDELDAAGIPRGAP